MTQALLGLGANIDNPLLQLTQAYRYLASHPALTANAVSQVYVSAPVGPQDQPDFYNAVVAIDTTVSAEDLLAIALDIEIKMGRQRQRRWGERRIDLDIILFGDQKIVRDSLEIPHPRAHQRRFVLDPLIELLGGEYVFPGGSSLDNLREQCTGQSIRVLCEFPR